MFLGVMESAKLEINSKPVDCDSDSAPTAPLTSASVVPSVTLESEDAEESEALNSEGEACNLMGKETQPDMVKEIVNEQSNYTGQNSTMTVNSADSSGPQQENRSYASIVLKAATSGASNLRWTPTETSPRTLGSPTLSAEPTASPPTSDVGPQSSNPQEGVEGHSIYIRNLPLNATVAHVTEEFTKFGPINHGGVQVKIHKEFGYCYGFVEFQSLNSMQNAIKESPLTIGGRRVVVEEKKSTIRVGSTGNAAKNKCQYSNFRRRGYFGRGYGRNFRSQSKSNSESCTEYRYQRVDRS